MTLLDLQGMEWTDDGEAGHDGSDLSVTICEVRGGSSLSVALCDVD
jgi:hypothetical protein